MMSKLVRHVERLAAERGKRAVRAVAAELTELVRNASVEIDGARVVARGRGLTKQWMGDPRLRFFGGNK